MEFSLYGNIIFCLESTHYFKIGNLWVRLWLSINWVLRSNFTSFYKSKEAVKFNTVVNNYYSVQIETGHCDEQWHHTQLLWIDQSWPWLLRTWWTSFVYQVSSPQILPLLNWQLGMFVSNIDCVPSWVLLAAMKNLVQLPRAHSVSTDAT